MEREEKKTFDHEKPSDAAGRGRNPQNVNIANTLFIFYKNQEISVEARYS